jgi:hypothetical protein
LPSSAAGTESPVLDLKNPRDCFTTSTKVLDRDQSRIRSRLHPMDEGTAVCAHTTPAAHATSVPAKAQQYMSRIPPDT